MTVEGELQHLGFVREKALAAQDLSVGVYKTLRSYTPSTVESTAASAEEAASAWLVPFWEWASGIGDKCLKSADGVVDRIGVAYKEKFEPTKEHVSKSTTEALDFVKKEGVTGVATKASERFSTLLKDMKIDAYLEWMQSEGLTGTAKAIYEKAPAQVSDKAAEIWSEVSRNPTVNKLVEYYMSVHDSVVGSKLYGSTWDSTTELLGKLEASPAYQSYIQPYATPAVEKVKGLTVTKKVYEHIKPIPTEEAPVTNEGEELTEVAKAE